MLNEKLNAWQKVMLAQSLLSRAIADNMRCENERNWQRVLILREKYHDLKDEWHNKCKAKNL